MRGLPLDPAEVASERQVILEEIAMYARRAVGRARARGAGRALRRPSLRPPGARHAGGARRRSARDELAGFHRRFYRPDNAVLVVAGDARPPTARGGSRRSSARSPGAAARRVPRSPVPRAPASAVAARAAPRRDRPAAPRAAGAAARPRRSTPRSGCSPPRSRSAARAGCSAALVEEGELCLAVYVGLSENVLDGSSLTIAAELLAGRRAGARRGGAIEEPRRARARGRSPDEELERARQVFLADWVDRPRADPPAGARRRRSRLPCSTSTAGAPAAPRACDGRRLRAVAPRRLDPERGAVLWSSASPCPSERDAWT